jgi:hypothetical protein
MYRTLQKGSMNQWITLENFPLVKSLEFHGDLRSPVPGLPTWPASPRPDESTRHRGVAVPTLLRLLRPLAFSSLVDRSSWYGHRMKMNGYNIVEYMKIQLIWKSSWYGNIWNIYEYIWNAI